MDIKRKRGNRGKRAGVSTFDAAIRDIHSRVRGSAAHNLTGKSTASLAMDAAQYFDCSTVDETREDHIVPRQSITRKQFLPFFPQRLETAAVPSKQLDKAGFDGKKYTDSNTAVADNRMIAVTDNRVTWKSDRTLLNRSKPVTDIADLSFKRDGSVSVGLNTRKFTRSDNERETLPGVILRYLDRTGECAEWFQTELEAKAYRRKLVPMPTRSTITPDDTDVIGPAAPDDLI